MRRRALLASLAACALPLTAGCSGDGHGTPTGETTAMPPGETTEMPTGEGTDAPPRTDTTTSEGRSNTPTETDTTDHSAQVTIHDVIVQRGYVERTAADAIDVVGGDRRYVWVDASVIAGTFAPDAFVLDTFLEEFSPITDAQPYRFESDGASAYTVDAGRGLLLFELPLDIETPQQQNVPGMEVRWPGGEYEIDRGVAKRIAKPNASLSVELENRYAETPATPIAVTVTNDHFVDRRFVAALNRTGPMVEVTPVARVTVDVPAGETRTVTVEDGWHETMPNGTPPDRRIAVEYDLHWATGSKRIAFQHV